MPLAKKFTTTEADFFIDEIGRRWDYRSGPEELEGEIFYIWTNKKEEESEYRMRLLTYSRVLYQGDYVDAVQNFDKSGASFSISEIWGDIAISGVYKNVLQVYSGSTEIKKIIRDSRVVHRRSTIYFYANGGSPDRVFFKTYGLEQITTPPLPVRSGYVFWGWATSANATAPNVTFPRDVKNQDAEYFYAVWTSAETTTPSITQVKIRRKSYARIRNEDDSAATIYADFSRNNYPPDPITNRGKIQPGKYIDIPLPGVSGATFSVAACAKADSKDRSRIKSATFILS